MQERAIILNPGVILGAVQTIVAHMTIPGNGHDYGISIPELTHHLNLSRMLPVQLNEAQVAKVLTMTNNGIAFFNSYKLMPSGEIVWKINTQNIIQPQMQNHPIRAPPLQIRRPPIDDFVSDNIVELEEEIERLKKKKQQLNERLAQLKYSYSLLEDPAKCLESSSKVDVSVQYMRNTYSLIDRKVNNLIINVDDTLSEPKR